MITPQQALTRLIEQREIFYDEMLSLMRQIMKGEVSAAQIAGNHRYAPQQLAVSEDDFIAAGNRRPAAVRARGLDQCGPRGRRQGTEAWLSCRMKRIEDRE